MFITRHSTKLAHAIRRPCPCPRPRRTLSSKSVNKDELINQILAQVEKDRNFISKVLEKAPSEEARHKIVRPIASHVGKVLDKEFAIADLDGNSQLSAIEIRNWYKQKYPSFRVAETMTGIRENISSAGRGEVAAEPTSTQHRQLAIQAGIPFIGFGFLDNAIMLVAGNQIEASMGVAFGITPLFAAGLGNMVSDVAGLKAGGVIEAIAAKLGLPDPGLSASQMKLSSVKRTTLLAGALGLAVGCLLGMFPLLFIDVRFILCSHIYYCDLENRCS